MSLPGFFTFLMMFEESIVGVDAAPKTVDPCIELETKELLSESRLLKSIFYTTNKSFCYITGLEASLLDDFLCFFLLDYSFYTFSSFSFGAESDPELFVVLFVIWYLELVVAWVVVWVVEWLTEWCEVVALFD